MSYYVNWKLVTEAMDKKCYTQQMLADKLGVKLITVQTWKKNKTGPLRCESHTLDKMCELLEIDKALILQEEPQLPKFMYEQILGCMLSVVQLNNIIEKHGNYFQAAIGKSDYKELCKALTQVRKLTSKAYVYAEENYE